MYINICISMCVYNVYCGSTDYQIRNLAFICMIGIS